MVKKNLLNIGALACIQGSNALLPIFSFPYVLSVVGSEKYAQVVVGESISLIILAFILFSFEINGVTKIINSLKNGKKTDETVNIYSQVLWTRLILWSVATVAVLCCYPLCGAGFIEVLLCWQLVPLSYILSSNYLYQALENNVPLAIFTGLSRLTCFALILRYIHVDTPAYQIPLMIGSCYIAGSFFSFLYINMKMKIRLTKCSVSNIKNALYEGKAIFFGNISVVLFRDSAVLILNTLGQNSVAIASYSVAEKLVKGLQAAIRPLNQFYFARTVHRLNHWQKPNKAAWATIIKNTKPQLAALASILLLTIAAWHLLSPYTHYLKTFPNQNMTFTLFFMMVIAVFFGAVNFMTGSVGLNTLNDAAYFTKALILVGVLTLFVNISLSYFFSAYGAAVAFVLGEVLLTLLIAARFLRTPK